MDVHAGGPCRQEMPHFMDDHANCDDAGKRNDADDHKIFFPPYSSEGCIIRRKNVCNIPVRARREPLLLPGFSAPVRKRRQAFVPQRPEYR